MFKTVRGVYFVLFVTILCCGTCKCLINSIRSVSFKINNNIDDVENLVPEVQEVLKKLPEEKNKNHDEFEIENPAFLYSDGPVEETNYKSKTNLEDAVLQKTRRVPAIHKELALFQNVKSKRRVLRQANSLYPQLPTQSPYNSYPNYNPYPNYNQPGQNPNYKPSGQNSSPYNQNDGQYPTYNVTLRPPYNPPNGQYPSYNATKNPQYYPGYNNNNPSYRPTYNQTGQYQPANPGYRPNNTSSYNPSQRPPYSQPGQYPNNYPNYPNQTPGNSHPIVYYNSTNQRAPYYIPGQYPSYNTSRPSYSSWPATNLTVPHGGSSFNNGQYPQQNYRPGYSPNNQSSQFPNNNYNPNYHNNLNVSTQRPPFYPPSNGHNTYNNNFQPNNPYNPHQNPSYHSSPNGQYPTYNNTNYAPHNSPGYKLGGPYNPSIPDRPPNQNLEQNHFFYPPNKNVTQFDHSNVHPGYFSK